MCRGGGNTHFTLRAEPMAPYPSSPPATLCSLSFRGASVQVPGGSVQALESGLSLSRLLPLVFSVLEKSSRKTRSFCGGKGHRIRLLPIMLLRQPSMSIICRRADQYYWSRPSISQRDILIETYASRRARRFTVHSYTCR